MNAAIETRDLCYTYEDGTVALDHISLKAQKGKITGIAEQRGGYSVGGYAVKKRAYLVKISGKQYYTAHGCLFAPFGRKQIGKEIWVFRNETYGREVFRCRDPRIEVLALVFFSAAVLCFLYA